MDSIHSVATFLSTSCQYCFCLQIYTNSSWHRFSKMFETFLKDIGPFRDDIITQLLHIHVVNDLFHHILKVLHWIEIW